MPDEGMALLGVAATGVVNGMTDVVPSFPRISSRSALEGLKQHTLQGVVSKSGSGLHSGKVVQVRLCPAPPESGKCFVRIDDPHAPGIPAQVENISQTVLSTELAYGGAAVRTVEHLLAALAGLGIDNVRIEIDGPEVPILDGSALEWVQGILEVGWKPQDAPRRALQLHHPVTVQQDDAFIVAVPALTPQFSYGIDFPSAVIGCQWHSVSLQDFATDISPARTFCLASDVEMLRNRGLIKGGSLENALVCNQEEWLNPPLRYTNEPVRHKLLDLIGDLSLMGALPRAHVLAYKASHSLHLQLAQRLLQLPSAVHTAAAVHDECSAPCP